MYMLAKLTTTETGVPGMVLPGIWTSWFSGR